MDEQSIDLETDSLWATLVHTIERIEQDDQRFIRVDLGHESVAPMRDKINRLATSCGLTNSPIIYVVNEPHERRADVFRRWLVMDCPFVDEPVKAAVWIDHSEGGFYDPPMISAAQREKMVSHLCALKLNRAGQLAAARAKGTSASGTRRPMVGITEMATADSTKLASLAEQFRRIPARMHNAIRERKMNSAGEAALVAGSLLVQAIEAEAFSDNPELLLAMQHSMATEPEGMKYGRAYCQAAKVLLNRPKGQCTELVADGCPAIADCIERLLKDLAAKAIEQTMPVPVQGVIWRNANAPTLPLAEAFNGYWQTLDAATVPAGDDRRIPEDAGAVLLSEATEGLHNALAAEHDRLLTAHGREVDPPDGIHLCESDYPDERDATPIPKSEFRVRVLDIGRDGADARLMTAIHRAQKATACPVERHNAQNAIKPGGPHWRYFAGDVIRRDTLDALESVGKLLRLNDRPLAENVARIEAAASALPAIMESQTKGLERVAAAIESVGPRADGMIKIEKAAAKPKRKRRTSTMEAKPLTDRELQAVNLADEGHGPTAIGKRLGVGKSYAHTLRKNGRKKIKALQEAVRASGNSTRPKFGLDDVQLANDDR